MHKFGGKTKALSCDTAVIISDRSNLPQFCAKHKSSTIKNLDFTLRRFGHFGIF